MTRTIVHADNLNPKSKTPPYPPDRYYKRKMREYLEQDLKDQEVIDLESIPKIHHTIMLVRQDQIAKTKVDRVLSARKKIVK